LRPDSDNPQFMRSGVANKFPTADVDYEKEWQHTPLPESNTTGELSWFNSPDKDNFWVGIHKYSDLTASNR